MCVCVACGVCVCVCVCVCMMSAVAADWYLYSEIKRLLLHASIY